MKYAFISEKKVAFPVAVLCRALAVSTSGYYASIVRPVSRHTRRDEGLLKRVKASHSSLRSQVVPVPAVAAPEENDKTSLPLSHYISWSQLLKKTFEIDTVCPRCKTPLRLIAMIETEDTIRKILSAMALPTCAPKLWPARPPPSQSAGERGDWLN